ncbi:MAG: hypothetical protein LH481_17735 [Burkholderiales bacterium]|nr:hypothetical protein [Burkholderiales bacterium]
MAETPHQCLRLVFNAKPVHRREFSVATANIDIQRRIVKLIAICFKFSATVFSLAVSACALAQNANQSANVTAQFKPAIETLVAPRHPALLAGYQVIHANPELGFQEVRTAALLAKQMRDLGFKGTERVGKIGVMAMSLAVLTALKR